MGAVAKSYMRKGFLIYEEMRKYFVIYDRSLLDFLKNMRKFFFLFYQCMLWYVILRGTLKIFEETVSRNEYFCEVLQN